MTRVEIVREVYGHRDFFIEKWAEFCEWVGNCVEDLSRYRGLKLRETPEAIAKELAGIAKALDEEGHKVLRQRQMAFSMPDGAGIVDDKLWEQLHARHEETRHRLETAKSKRERLPRRLLAKGWAMWKRADGPCGDGKYSTMGLLLPDPQDRCAPCRIVNPVLWLFDSPNPRPSDPDYKKEQLLLDCALLAIAHDATVAVTKRMCRWETYQGERFDREWVFARLPHRLDEMEGKGQLQGAWEEVKPYAEQASRKPNGPGQSDETPANTIAKRFRIALSFPGEHRPFVEQIASHLAGQVGQERVLYDKYYEAELARVDLDTYLQKLYHDESELIAVFLCAAYMEKEWCGLEWRAIRDIIKRRRASDVMPLRFDDTDVPGLFSIDGYVPIGNRSPQEIGDLILQRLAK